VALPRMTFLTVFLDRLKSRAICRIPFLSLWYAQRILRMVSTISISFHLLLSLVGSRELEGFAEVGQFSMPICLKTGSILHADQQVVFRFLFADRPSDRFQGLSGTVNPDAVQKGIWKPTG
jgi:hypothetical protein